MVEIPSGLLGMEAMGMVRSVCVLQPKGEHLVEWARVETL